MWIKNLTFDQRIKENEYYATKLGDTTDGGPRNVAQMGKGQKLWQIIINTWCIDSMMAYFKTEPRVVVAVGLSPEELAEAVTRRVNNLKLRRLRFYELDGAKWDSVQHVVFKHLDAMILHTLHSVVFPLYP